MSEDQFEEFLERTAPQYRPPPPTPRDQIWARIEASRQAKAGARSNDEGRGGADAQTNLGGRGSVGGRGSAGDRANAGDRGNAGSQVIDLASRRPRPRWNWIVLAAAAVLLVGIGIGRFVLPTPATTAPVAPVISAAPTGESAAFKLATVAALSQVKTLLVDYDADRITDDFQAATQELLATTRLLLSSPRLSDPATRQLLEDLELVLVQVARLSRSGQGEERGFIDDGMAERSIRQRLGSAIPAGPTA